MDFDLGPRLILDRDRRAAIWALVSRPLGHHLLDPHGCHFLVVRHRFGVWQDGDTRIDGHVACPCYRVELCQVMVGALGAVGLHAFRQIIFGRRVGVDPWEQSSNKNQTPWKASEESNSERGNMN